MKKMLLGSAELVLSMVLMSIAGLQIFPRESLRLWVGSLQHKERFLKITESGADDGKAIRFWVSS